ncbi:unnamed protein product [Enterobius vermicularis]|uniref:Clathrin assembly protein n=1 Tax=Enterobius vermicularis TaxID=51028 RepID=A0A0N4VRG4_ENTVE|nr:unnamed protein product [Enterobius vermicularis]
MVKKVMTSRDAQALCQSSSWLITRFINARRRIVQPMIDQSNRAGRTNGVNVFKNRRRKSSGQSPGPSPVGMAHPAFSNPAALAPQMFMSNPMSHMMAPYSAAPTQMGATNVWETLMPGHMSMDA